MTSLLDQLQPAFPATYVLEHEVGRGGMATVFLARDVRYNRKVAVKVLSPELGAVLGGERFLGEIRVTATLQHPNLLPLFDSGEANGLLYYVMPFVEGETLRAKLEREKQLSVSETVRLGSAIASALDYAHRNGVIHRDLKPENILLQDGQPLVADFGIALAVSNAGGTRVTQTGLSLGTPQYMSPEQATGDRVIDARSDVYALGAILYECLTGEPPHTGTTAQAIIARLMTEEPRAITASRKNVPAHVDAAIRKALEKLPADRWASTREFAEALANASATNALGIAGDQALRSAAGERGWSRRATLWGVTGLLGGAGAVAAAVALMRPDTDTRTLQLDINPPAGVRLANPAGRTLDISADGRAVLFLGSDSGSGGQRVYVRRLDEPDAAPLEGSDAATSPVFDATGKTVVYRAPDGFRIHTLDTRSPRMMVPQTAGYSGAAWDAGDRFVFGSNGIWSVDANGGDKRQLVTLGGAARIANVSNPYVLAGGKLIVFRARVDEEYKLAVVAAEGGEVTVLDTKFPGVLGNIIGQRDDVLILGMLDGTLQGLRFDATKRTPIGELVTLLENVSAKNAGGANAKVSDDGTLVYLRGSPLRRLGIASREGVFGELQMAPGDFDRVRWSPSGQRLLVEQWESATSRSRTIWMLDVTTGTFSRIVDGSGLDPQWSPDGRAIVFERDPPDDEGVYYAPIDGSEPVRKLFGSGFNDPSFTPDGKAIVMRRDSAGGPSRIVWASLNDLQVLKDIVRAPEDLSDPVVSPDGQWVAYTATAALERSVYVSPLTPGGGRTRIASDRAQRPRWSGDGRTLFYYTRDGRLASASLTFTGRGVTVGAVDVVRGAAELDLADVSLDGLRIAGLRRSAESDTRIIVHTNWWNSVKERMRTKR